MTRVAAVAVVLPGLVAGHTDIGITKLNGSGNRTVEALLKLAASR